MPVPTEPRFRTVLSNPPSGERPKRKNKPGGPTLLLPSIGEPPLRHPILPLPNEPSKYFPSTGQATRQILIISIEKKSPRSKSLNLDPDNVSQTRVVFLHNNSPDRTMANQLPKLIQGHTSPAPVPTRVISNEEFVPPPQTVKQQQVEWLIHRHSQELTHHLGIDRREFLRGNSPRTTSTL